MGDTIKLSIEIQGREEAIASLSDTDKLAEKLRKKPITIPVEKGAVRDIEETASDLGKLAKVTETFINQEEKASKVTQTFKNGVGQVTTVVKQLNDEATAYDETLKTVTKDYDAQARAVEKAAKEAQKKAEAEAAAVAGVDVVYERGVFKRAPAVLSAELFGSSTEVGLLITDYQQIGLVRETVYAPEYAVTPGKRRADRSVDKARRDERLYRLSLGGVKLHPCQIHFPPPVPQTDRAPSAQSREL